MVTTARQASVKPTPLTRSAGAAVPSTTRAVIPQQVLAPPAPSLPVVDTSIWGPPLWTVLHIAAQYGPTRGGQANWMSLLKALRTGIPCPDCAGHYNAWINSHPIRASLIPGQTFDIGKWILDLHNDVNKRTGKPTWSMAQVVATYSNRIANAKESAAFLQGKIGNQAFHAIMTLLNTMT